MQGHRHLSHPCPQPSAPARYPTRTRGENLAFQSRLTRTSRTSIGGAVQATVRDLSSLWWYMNLLVPVSRFPFPYSIPPSSHLFSFRASFVSGFLLFSSASRDIRHDTLHSQDLTPSPRRCWLLGPLGLSLQERSTSNPRRPFSSRRKHTRTDHGAYETKLYRHQNIGQAVDDSSRILLHGHRW